MADPKNKNDKRDNAPKTRTEPKDRKRTGLTRTSEPAKDRKNKIKVVENNETRGPNLPPVKEEERPIGNGDTIERIRVGDNRSRR